MTLVEAAMAYKDKFGSMPTLMGMPPEVEDEAIVLLSNAVEDDRPFADDEDFYNSLGLDPPPEDVET